MDQPAQQPDDSHVGLILRLEARLLAGQKVSMDELADVPASLLYQSPSLMQRYGAHLVSEGKLAEAKSLLTLAVQGYARQSDSRQLIRMLALLADLHLQIGDIHEAVTLLRFLRDEYERQEEQNEGIGQLPLVLAKGGYVLHPEVSSAPLYRQALEAFADTASHPEIVYTLMDWWFLSPDSMESEDWERWLQYLKQQALIREDCRQPYALLLAMNEIRFRQIASVTARLAEMDTTQIPRRYAILAQIELERSILRSGQPLSLHEMDASIDRLKHLLQKCHHDIDVQLHGTHVLFMLHLRRGNEAEKDQALAQARSLCRMTMNPAHQSLLQEMETQIQACTTPTIAAETEETFKIFCMGGLRIQGRHAEVKEIRWKRTKAKELFVYLSLQSEYRALKEEVTELLFADVEPVKAANRLYVAVHQLKHILKEAVGFEHAVMMKEGVVCLKEQQIEFVDLEKYTTLVGVAHQLWATDRETAVELYDKAAGMYGDLLPELPYLDWLARYRAALEEKQSLLLSRLGWHYQQANEAEKAEFYYHQWVDTFPQREEAYQRLLELLMAQGRKSEAIRLLRRLENVCREELGTVPLRETERLVWG